MKGCSPLTSFAQDFQLHFDRPANGERSGNAAFTYIDLAGAFRSGSMRWQNLHKLEDGTLQSVGPVNLDVKIDGSSVLATSITFSPGCPSAGDMSTLAPIVNADAQHAPELPNNQELYTLIYKATNPIAVEDLARLVRSFTPPTSRIIPNEMTGELHVTDTATSLRKVYVLIRDNDIKPTQEMRMKWQKIMKEADSKWESK